MIHLIGVVQVRITCKLSKGISFVALEKNLMFKFKVFV